MPIDTKKLDRLAEVAVRIGLNLQAGQDLLITAPVAALPLVRKITAHAYAAGANVVTPLFSDPDLTLARYRHAKDASFDHAPAWLYDGMSRAFESNTARLAISGDDPLLLFQEDHDRVGRANRATSLAYKPALEKIARFDINWNIVSYPNPEWAKRVFPDLPIKDATARLADAIFAASRIGEDDPVAAWQAHNADLQARAAWLNEQNFSALRFTGPGTYLHVGLADGHKWQGGASVAGNGITCNPNIPTEEVFTTPHAYRVNGHVASTKPLSHNGTLIENIRVSFRDGAICDAHATQGEKVLQRLIETDDGARRLGEVALVPHSSPISASGLLFLNTLYDENAASHIALGQCYAKCFHGNTTAEQMSRQGGNSSLVHVDWMIGSDQVNVDGVASDGTSIPVFRKGEWA